MLWESQWHLDCIFKILLFIFVSGCICEAYSSLQYAIVFSDVALIVVLGSMGNLSAGGEQPAIINAICVCVSGFFWELANFTQIGNCNLVDMYIF